MNHGLTLRTAAWDRYREYAKGLGFLEIAAAPAERVDKEAELRDWTARGRHAEMHWFARVWRKDWTRRWSWKTWRR